MADFCQQCSIEIFGEDLGDFAEAVKPYLPFDSGFGLPVICEGCGFTLVAEGGRCISPHCQKSHGDSYE